MGAATQRGAGPACLSEYGRRIGESHPRAKLSDRDVELLMALRDEGYSYRWLARKFEVSVSHCWRICLGLQRNRLVMRWRS